MATRTITTSTEPPASTKFSSGSRSLDSSPGTSNQSGIALLTLAQHVLPTWTLFKLIGQCGAGLAFDQTRQMPGAPSQRRMRKQQRNGSNQPQHGGHQRLADTARH